MKKILKFMILTAVIISLTACKKEIGTEENTETSIKTVGMTKEEMLEVAEVAEEVEMNNALVENIVSAKQTYCDKVLEVTAPVYMIEEDYILVGQNGSSLIVYLPEEDIVNLQLKQWITLVGLTNDDIQTETRKVGPMEFEYQCFVMEHAYFVTDRYEYMGTPESENDSFAGAWNVAFPGQSLRKVVYFDEGVDVSKYVGEEITFTAQYIDGKYYNAAIEQK